MPGNNPITMGDANPDFPMMKCPECGAGVQESAAQRCPQCGGALNQGMNRGRLWLLFWVAFLLTPVVSAFTLVIGIGILILFAGAIFCGNLLAKLFTRTNSRLVLMTFLYTLLVLVVYGGIAFAGCLVMLNGTH